MVDALLLARSGFHHSINYRSVVALGKARLLTQRDERLHALEILTDHVVPGRWAEVRAPNEIELKQTSVLSLSLDEVSAKIRTGPPADDDEDYALPVWAGVLPLETRLGAPADDGRVLAGVAAPDVARFTRFARPMRYEPVGARVGGAASSNDPRSTR